MITMFPRLETAGYSRDTCEGAHVDADDDYDCVDVGGHDVNDADDDNDADNGEYGVDADCSCHERGNDGDDCDYYVVLLLVRMI